MKWIVLSIVFSDRHKLSRHQYYLQLRKDFLEERLSCHEESSLCLAGLALQAEYGDCMPQVPVPGISSFVFLLVFILSAVFAY